MPKNTFTVSVGPAGFTSPAINIGAKKGCSLKVDPANWTANGNTLDLQIFSSADNGNTWEHRFGAVWSFDSVVEGRDSGEPRWKPPQLAWDPAPGDSKQPTRFRAFAKTMQTVDITATIETY